MSKHFHVKKFENFTTPLEHFRNLPNLLITTPPPTQTTCYSNNCARAAAIHRAQPPRTHSAGVEAGVHASQFEYYYCESKKLIGINVFNLNKIIKTINNNDSLTLWRCKLPHFALEKSRARCAA